MALFLNLFYNLTNHLSNLYNILKSFILKGKSFINESYLLLIHCSDLRHKGRETLIKIENNTKAKESERCSAADKVRIKIFLNVL